MLRIDRALQELAQATFLVAPARMVSSLQQLNLSRMLCMLIVNMRIGRDNEEVAGIVSPTHR